MYDRRQATVGPNSVSVYCTFENNTPQKYCNHRQETMILDSSLYKFQLRKNTEMKRVLLFAYLRENSEICRQSSMTIKSDTWG